MLFLMRLNIWVGRQLLHYFDGLQWYLTAREDPKWREENDPNDEFWNE